jgi:3'-5' exonuclease
MLKLNKKLVKDCMQTMFRRWETLKVGFGLEGDLKAVSAAIGMEGGGCIALLRSAVELRHLHRSLLRLGAPVPLTTGQSLSGLVASMLAKPLSKSQQCSAWHQRPLSEPQIVYAANDAAVLLALFDAFVAAAPPADFPTVRAIHSIVLEERAGRLAGTASNAATTATDETTSRATTQLDQRAAGPYPYAVSRQTGVCLTGTLAGAVRCRQL